MAVEWEPADLECIFSAYVTAKMTTEVLKDFVESSANEWPSKGNMKSPYLFSIIRNEAEATAELVRLKTLETLSGTQPPISETDDYNFLGMNLYDLAKFTLEKFPNHSNINNTYFVVLDERSVKDRTCILVKIPCQEYDENGPARRVFHKREEYKPDPNAWVDEETLDDTAPEDLKCVRVTFEDANMANMLDDGHEGIGYLAQYTYGTDGVFREGAAYPDSGDPCLEERNE